MHNELSAENRDAILRAVAELQARGSDVNAYSLAAQANVSRAEILADPQIMELLAKTRGAPSSNGHSRPHAAADEGLSERVQQLERDQEAAKHELAKARWHNQILRKKVDELLAENERLKQAAAQLQEEAQNISKSVNIAWQQGYLAGQQVAVTEAPAAKSFVETLAEAARAATTIGDGAEAVSAAADDATACEAKAEEEAPFIADVPLQIDDPEVLSDPFTAKLMNALHAEHAETTADDEASDETAVNRRALTPEEIEQWARAQGIPAEQAQELLAAQGDSDYIEAQRDTVVDQGRTLVDAPRQVRVEADAASCEADEDQDTTLVNAPRQLHEEAAAAAAAGKSPADSSTDQFTADELHNLFRNRYVRQDEAPEVAQPAPKPALEASQTTKKFVGGKHSATLDSIPAVPRVFPPDIRKACRLLGINPEELSKQTVLDAWKHEMAKPGVHPDTGGDTEMAIYLNTAKDTLMRWVEAQTPKLGKKFGSQQAKTSDIPKPQSKPE